MHVLNRSCSDEVYATLAGLRNVEVEKQYVMVFVRRQVVYVSLAAVVTGPVVGKLVIVQDMLVRDEGRRGKKFLVAAADDIDLRALFGSSRAQDHANQLEKQQIGVVAETDALERKVQNMATLLTAF